MSQAALFAALLLITGPAAAAPLPRVKLDTSAGPIVIELDTVRAPITAGNFLKYVEEHRLDGTTFYRAARSKRDPKVGLVQGGINHSIKRSRFPIAHEPTSKTGLRHVDGTISMARNAPGTAMGDFFIVVGGAPYLDAAPNYPGYAAFGHVVSGMPVVKRILALPTFPGGYSEMTIGQTLKAKVTIKAAHAAAIEERLGSSHVTAANWRRQTMADRDERVVVEKSNANINIGGIIAAIALLLLVLGVLKFMGVSPI